MLTPWNYEILNAEQIPPIITLAEFNEMTNDKYATDERAQQTINAVTSSIRNYCGWHLAGNVECRVTYTFDDLHITRNGRDLIVQLPTRHATGITNVIYDGTQSMTLATKNHLKQNGIFKLYDFAPWFNRYDKLVIDFMSGLTDDGVKNIIAQRVSNTLSGNAGINSETAGGVSITYNQSYVNGLNPTSLLTADREFLQPYIIKEML